MTEDKLQSKWSKPTTEVLLNRHTNLLALLNKHLEYPFKVRMVGFPLLQLHSEEDLKSRIRELSDILNIRVTEIAQLPNGSEVWKDITNLGG